MISSKNVANAVGGKTARACDSCIKKRARWYCAADDAFLCQACDGSVHSANSLARRHERVRLKTASFKSSPSTGRAVNSGDSVPSWHRGITRKARTPRHGKLLSNQKKKAKPNQSIRNPLPFVPEVGADEISHEENEEEQLLYRVPIFDPFSAELCASANSNEAEKTATNDAEIADHENGSESKVVVVAAGYGSGDVDCLHGFFPSDMELAEFAADVESLLGRGFENESCAMEELGLMDYKEKDLKECCLGNSGKVKLEEEAEVVINNQCQVDSGIDMEREPLELNFDYDSPTATCTPEEDKKVVKEEITMETSGGFEEEEEEDSPKKKRKILLSLDYEAVISAWASQGSPWTTGCRPEFDPDECWPDCMGACGTEFHHPYMDMGEIGSNPAVADGGREARVSRYREKRRTRLFSKKIRYEVRKLNAEKRPRMKGRFVKRATFAGPPAFPLFN